MIILNKLGKERKEFVLNSDLIEFIEENPDTVITLNSGKKYMVIQKKEEIIERIVEYKRKITMT